MSDLRFKIWDLLTKEWTKENSFQLLKTEGQNNYYFRNYLLNNDDFTSGERYIVVQWIGLSDKNGNPIFEGDILRITNWPYLDHSTERDFSKPFYKLEKVVYDAPEFNLNRWLRFESCDYEIVGNIFQNPNLLTK